MALVDQTPREPSAPELKAMVRVATSKLAKLGVVVPIPIRPFGPIVMEPIVEVPLRPVTEIVPPTVKLEEAFRIPLTKRLELMVEEAVERKPVKVERPSTFKVEEAESGPLTLKLELTVEEALEINPPAKVERPLANRVEEAFKTPETWKFPATVEEAEEIKPARVESPAISAVEAKVTEDEA